MNRFLVKKVKIIMMDMLDETTQSNIAAAHVKDGLSPQRAILPFRNIRDVLGLHAKTSGNKPFLIAYDEQDQRTELSYVEFVSRVHQIANFLYEDLGVRRGDRIATIAHNHQDVVLIYFACWVIGATVAPQNVAEDDLRIAFILRNSEARICFVMGEHAERAERILYGGPGGENELGAHNIQAVVQLGGKPHEAWLDFHESVRNRPTTFLGDDSGAKSGDIPLLAGNSRTATLDDEALLVYTSGTTGAPKGVVLTQFNLLIDAQAISQWQAITGNQRLMCVLPIHHVNGIVMTLITPLYVGASTVLNPRFSVQHFWERIVRDRVSIVSTVPTLLQFLLEYAAAQEAAGNTPFGHSINRRDLSRFRHLICGAGTLSLGLARAFEDKFGFPILHGYGLSETTCYSCYLPTTLSWEMHQSWMLEHGYPSIGCAIGCNEMAIFSADGSGQRLGPGERGEICIRGHNVMKHYYKRPDANAEAFRFGWFRSGDEGFYLEDEQGQHFFFITGRIKELINRGGVKFSPFDIEEVISSYPGVKAGLAIGFENDYYGEEVGAYVVMEAGQSLDEQALLEHCREQLTFEKAPKVIVQGTEIPVTSTGKYQRLRLAPLFSAHKTTQFRR